MTYVNPGFSPYQDSVIYPPSLQSLALEMIQSNLASAASTAWPTAAKAIYIPFWITRPRTIYQVGWYNGALPGTNIREVGVYNAAGTKLIAGSSGSVAHTASVIERVNVTDTVILPGQYWIAAQSNTVDTWLGWTLTAPLAASMGILTQTTANPLPSTATMALDHVNPFVPFAIIELRPVA